MATIPMCTQSPLGCLPTVREANKVRDAVALHRIAEVRAQQGVSLRAISRRSGVDIHELRRQELPDSNLTLIDLIRWAKALEVPVENLIVDNDSELSDPVQSRAALVKVMKTVVALTEVAASPRVARLTTMLREQMIELMPELAEIGGWPNFGSRRPPDQQGRIGENPIDVQSLRLE
jgi:transcriptional regulator with XRE-family HTH domain